MVAVMIGMFAFAEMIRLSKQTESIAKKVMGSGSRWRGIRWTLKEWKAVLRGSAIGVGVGIVPGEGATVATFISYITEKQMSSEPERFGKGHPAGIAGPEAANNSVIAGALVPTLSFGIPGSVATALLLTALTLHGIRPGPSLLSNNLIVLYSIIGSILIGGILTIIIGLTMSRSLSLLTIIPVSVLVPIVSVMSVIGVYASNFTYAHIFMALGAGALGYAFVRFDYPIVAFLLGFIVGPLAEENFMRSYQITDGRLLEIFHRPISAILLILTIFILLRPFFRALRNHRKKIKTSA
jgi:putative tricarboxylic transport membrane protein